MFHVNVLIRKVWWNAQFPATFSSSVLWYSSFLTHLCHPIKYKKGAVFLFIVSPVCSQEVNTYNSLPSWTWSVLFVLWRLCFICTVLLKIHFQVNPLEIQVIWVQDFHPIVYDDKTLWYVRLLSKYSTVFVRYPIPYSNRN